MFAYRKVPNESTGVSPFELPYGRHIIGPPTVIKDSWEDPKVEVSKDSVLSYIIKTRERLHEIQDIAKSNEVASKKTQKTCKRSVKPGRKVCILLSSVSNKLHAEWKGPFEVIEQFGPVD